VTDLERRLDRFETLAADWLASWRRMGRNVSYICGSLCTIAN